MILKLNKHRNTLMTDNLNYTCIRQRNAYDIQMFANVCWIQHKMGKKTLNIFAIKRWLFYFSAGHLLLLLQHGQFYFDMVNFLFEFPLCMKQFQVTVKYVSGIFIAQNSKLTVQFHEIPNVRRYKHMRYIYGVPSYSLSYRRGKHNICDEKDN